MRKSANEAKIMTTTWNKDLEVGAAIEGKYIGMETFEGKYGMTNKYIVRGTDGVDWGVFGSASLDRQFAKIDEGSYVWIEYKGEEKTKNGRTVKVYVVDYDDEPAI